MPTQDNPFAKRTGAQVQKEKAIKVFLLLATYSILLFTLFVFLEIVVNGTPVLKQYGWEFLKRKPETLEVIAFDAGDKLEIPKQSFDTMITYNPSEGVIESAEDFAKPFQYVNFQIEPGSKISDGYLYNIEKHNKFRADYLSRDLVAPVGFSVKNDSSLQLSPETYAAVTKASPAFQQLAKSQIETESKTIQVTFSEKTCELQAKTLVQLAKSSLIYKLYGNLTDTADDKPTELMELSIPKTQTVSLSPSQYAAIQADTGSAEFTQGEEIIKKTPQIVVTLPAGQYQLPFDQLVRVLDENSSATFSHLHNLERGVIALDLPNTSIPLQLPKSEFDQMRADNPGLKLTAIAPHTKEQDFVRFDFIRAAEIKLPTTDMSAFRISNEGATNDNAQPLLKVLDEHVYPYSGGGVSGPLWGTILLVSTCMIIGLSIGVAAAIFLGEYSKKGKLITVIRLSMMNLAGVPSIVFGIFGLALFVSLAPKMTDTPSIDDKFRVPILPSFSEPGLRTQERMRIVILDDDKDQVFALRAAQQQGFERYYSGWTFISFQGWGNSIIAGAFTLAIMVLPIIITSSEESLKAVPRGFREASLALGATKWQAIKTAVLPYATPGMLTASVLGITRVAGETAPIMFTAAVAAKSDLPFKGLHGTGLGKFFDFVSQSVQAMPYHIYTISGKLPPSHHIKPMQYGSVLVFMIIVMTFAGLSVWLRIRMRKKYKW